jgi:hypothetical protein
VNDKLMPTRQLTDAQVLILSNHARDCMFGNPDRACKLAAILTADRDLIPFTEAEHARVAEIDRTYVRVPVTEQKTYTQVKEGKPADCHAEVIRHVERHLGYPLMQVGKNKSRYESADKKVGVLVMVSKMYYHTLFPSNWYSPTNAGIEFMLEHDKLERGKSYAVLACDGGNIILLPGAVAHDLFLKTTKTPPKNGESAYHHQIKVTWELSGAVLHTSGRGNAQNVQNHVIV